MKRLLGAACAALLWIGSAVQAQVQFGTGPDSSFLVIEAADFNGGNPLFFQWNYTYDPLNPRTTADMLIALDPVSLDLNFTLIFGGTFLDAIEYQSVTLTNEFLPPFSPFWAHWVAGGASGIPLGPVADGVWSPGFGIANRTLAPNSWDGFIFNGVYDENPPYDVISPAPSINPIPEPSTLGLMLFTTLGLIAYVRTRLQRS